MNKVFKKEEKYYFQPEGSKKSEEISTWFEKKSGITWLRLPKNNPSGRQYVSTNKLDKTGSYEFENKTTGPRTLVVTWNWKSRMTPEESKKYEECQDYIEYIRNECMTRKPVELTEEQKLAAEIAKLQEKLKKLKG